MYDLGKGMNGIGARLWFIEEWMENEAVEIYSFSFSFKKLGSKREIMKYGEIEEDVEF